MSPLKREAFLERLEQEAQLQADVYRTQILPSKVRGLARFVAAYPWQTLAVVSGLTALALEMIK